MMLDTTTTLNRPAFTYHQDDIRGMRIGRWKYILRGGDLEGLYDLDVSPFETDDRSERFPIVHRYMRDIIAFHLAYDTEWKKTGWGLANNHSAELAVRLDEAVW